MRALVLVLLAFVWAPSVARAQFDPFDVPSPPPPVPSVPRTPPSTVPARPPLATTPATPPAATTPPTPPITTPPVTTPPVTTPPVDLIPSPPSTPLGTQGGLLGIAPPIALDDATKSALLEVVAVTELGLRPDTVGSDTRLATLGTRRGRGVALDDGTLVVVPAALVRGASAYFVRHEGTSEHRVAILLVTDARQGVAVLRLATAFAPGVAIPSEPVATAPESPLTGAVLVEGTPATFGARRRAFAPDSDRVDIASTVPPEGALVVDGERRFAGVLVVDGADAATTSRLVTPGVLRAILDSLDAATRTRRPEGNVAADRPAARALSAALASLTAVAGAPTIDRAREVLRLERGAGAHGTVASADLPADAMLLAILAAHESNLAQAAREAHAADDAQSLQAGSLALVDRAVTADATLRRTSLFVEDSCARRDAEARAEVRRARAPTFLVAGGTSFARDGTRSLGGGYVSAGLFATFPSLSTTGLVRGGAALGASFGVGADGHGAMGFFTADVGGSLRLGRDLGAFVLATYSPGFVSTSAQGGSALAPVGFRVAVGMAIHRSNVFLGYRILAPRSDYSFHAIELGVAFRHGPRARGTAR